jgi:hypothetical protein
MSMTSYTTQTKLSQNIRIALPSTNILLAILNLNNPFLVKINPWKMQSHSN